MWICTLYALFGEDIRVSSVSKGSDTAFEVLSSIVFFSFIAEMLLLAHCKVRKKFGMGQRPLENAPNTRCFFVCLWLQKDYLLPMPWKSTTQPSYWLCGRLKTQQLGSFEFWVDVLSIVSMLTELPWLTNLRVYEAPDVTVVDSGGFSSLGTSSSIENPVGVIVRYLRLLRVFRVARIYNYAFRWLQPMFRQTSHPADSGRIKRETRCLPLFRAGSEPPENELDNDNDFDGESMRSHQKNTHSRCRSTGNLQIGISPPAKTYHATSEPSLLNDDDNFAIGNTYSGDPYEHWEVAIASVFDYYRKMEKSRSDGDASVGKLSESASYSPKATTDSRIGATLSDISIRRAIVGVLLMSLFVPPLMLEECESTNQMLVKSVFDLKQGGEEEALTFGIERLKEFAEPPLVKLQINEEEEMVQRPLSSFRNYELGKVEYVSAPGGDDVKVIGYFDYTDDIQSFAVANILLTIVVFALVLLTTLSFQLDISRSIIRPIRDMVSVVKMVSEHPLKQVNLSDVTSPSLAEAVRNPRGTSDQTLEIVYLTRMFLAIGDVLRMGFGEKGASIITHKLNRRGELDVLSEAKRTEVVLVHFRLHEKLATQGSALERVRQHIIEDIHKVVQKKKGSIICNLINGVCAVWKLEPHADEEQTFAGLTTPQESIDESEAGASEGGPESLTDDLSESGKRRQTQPSYPSASTIVAKDVHLQFPETVSVFNRKQPTEQWKDIGKRATFIASHSELFCPKDDHLIATLPSAGFALECAKWVIGGDNEGEDKENAQKNSHRNDYDDFSLHAVNLNSLEMSRGNSGADRALLAAMEVAGKVYGKYSEDGNLPLSSEYPVSVGLHIGECYEAVMGSSRKLDTGYFTPEFAFTVSLSAAAASNNLAVFLSESFYHSLSFVPRCLCQRVTRRYWKGTGEINYRWIYTLPCDFSHTAFSQSSSKSESTGSIVWQNRKAPRDEILSGRSNSDRRDQLNTSTGSQMMLLSPADSKEIIACIVKYKQSKLENPDHSRSHHGIGKTETSYHFAKVKFRRGPSPSDSNLLYPQYTTVQSVSHTKSGPIQRFLKSFSRHKSVDRSSDLEQNNSFTSKNKGLAQDEFEFFNAESYDDSPLVWLFDLNFLKLRRRGSLIYRLWYDAAIQALYSEHDLLVHTIASISRVGHIQLASASREERRAVKSTLLAFAYFDKAMQKYGENSLCGGQLEVLSAMMSDDELAHAKQLCIESEERLLRYGQDTARATLGNTSKDTFVSFEKQWKKSFRCVA